MSRTATDSTSNTWNTTVTGQVTVERAALTGDVTADANSNATTIADNTVTLAKMAQVATDTLLGRSTAGIGNVETITCTSFARSFLDDADEPTFKATVNLEIGIDVQAYNAALDDISGLAKTDGNFIVGDGANWTAESDTTVRDSLSLGTGDSPQFTNETLTGYEDLTEIAEPSSPSSNISRVYAADVDNVTHLFSKDSGGRNRLLTNFAFNVLEYGATGDGSTDDTTAVSNAVSAANTAGDWLYWPEGTYVTSSSIANLHNVKHIGPGVIKRGSDTFEVDPIYADANIIYVAASGGNDSNDGLSSSQALATIQQAFTNILNYGPVLNGSWTIQLAAGTYTHTTSAVCQISTVNTAKRLIIVGPTLTQGSSQKINFYMENMSGAFSAGETVTGGSSGATAVLDTIDGNIFYLTGSSGTFQIGETITGGTSSQTGDIVAFFLVPTAIIDGTGGASGTHGITLYEGNFTIQDIKLQNFDSHTNRCGIVAQDSANLYTVNVHCDAIGWVGIYGTLNSICRVQGGHLNDCREGVTLNASQGTVGYGSSALSDGCLLSNNTEKGAYWSRGAQGHVDYCIFESNVIGLLGGQNSRVHDVNCEFKNNTTAVMMRSGAIWANDSGNSFNIGTSDANTTVVDIGAFCGDADELLDVSGSGFSVDARSEILIARDLTDNSHTGDTSRTVLATPWTIPAGYFTASGSTSNIPKKLRIKLTGTRTGTSGTVSVGVDFGGSAAFTLAMVGTAATSFTAEIEIWSNGDSAQISRGELRQGTAGTESVRRTPRTGTSISMTSDVALQIIGLLTNAADTITVETIEIFLTG